MDFFTPSLMLSHKEFFEKELSSLVNEGAEVAFKPIIGVDLNGASLRRAKLIGASFYRANLAEADLEGIDGRYANFIGANLSGANLCGADLRFADFSDAALDGADLKGAKIDHSVFSRANLYKSNIDVVKAVCVDFSQAEMGSSNITNCKFAHTRFSFSDLSNARIVDSGFFRCDLGRIKINEGEVSCVEFSHVNANSILSNSAVFRKVTLDSVDLNGSVINNGLFFECKLSGVDLSFSKISETSFQGSELYRSLLNNVSIFCISFYNSAFGYVSLVDLDLTPFLEADIKHTGPNNVDYMSVTKTIMRDIGHPLDIDSHSKLKDFLVACGMPAVVAMYLIDSIRSLNPEQMVSLMRSTFISYGGPDEEFAKKINADLRKNGVRTFYFPMNAVFGEKLHSTMRRVEDYDRIILICSERSLDRGGVQYEIEKTLEREARGGGESYLIPISLDRYLFDEWEPVRKELKMEITNRVVADFSHPEDYDIQFSRLLYALRKDEISGE